LIARRQIILALGAGALAAPLASFSQDRRMVPRVGLLVPESLSVEAARIDALRAGLRDRGYVDGTNIAIEIRSADGNYERLPQLVAELISLRVDVIVTFGGKAVLAAQRATTAIPIVDPVMGDPVALGLSASLAHPGKNITGTIQFSVEAGAKRLEFLKEAIPRITRIAVLINPANAGSPRQLEAMRGTASALKLELQALEVRNAKALGEAFAAIAQRRLEGIVVPTDSLFRANVVEIVDRAAKQRLPSVGSKEFGVAGGLIGYGPDAVDLYRHAAYFVDRILKGAKPDDLPIEQATRLVLVVNLKAAKALGVTIPQSLLLRANEVIQ
jgi:putative ABC transport system substrate-binding protein